MSELEFGRTTRSMRRNNQPQPEHRQPNPEPNPRNNQGRKRIPQQRSLLGMGFRKQEGPPVTEPQEILSSIKQLLKTINIETIIENCPKIKNLYQKLREKEFVSEELALRCLDKYFHGNTTSLWEIKYAPKTIQDLFQGEFAEKVQQWIKDFYYFRKQNYDIDSDFGFIDDQSQEYSKSLQARMRGYGWNCRALVLRGRNGVGKRSLLTSIAKSMKIKCFQFSSDVDQYQKMKELEDGSCSEVVNNMNGKKKKQQQNNRLIMGNQLIANYIPGQKTDKETSLQTKQPKRMQIFRNFYHYYPPFDKADKQGVQENYFKYLFDKIEKSTFPYALTSDRFSQPFKEKNLNSKYSAFDVLEFIEPTVDDLLAFFWTIWQIEKNISINLHKKISKNDLFKELNEGFEEIVIAEKLSDEELIRKLILKGNKKLSYVFKYLQFRILPLIKKTKTTLKYQKTGEEKKIPEEIVGTQDQTEEKKDSSNSKSMVADEEDIFEEMFPQISFEILENVTPQSLVNSIDWCYYEKPKKQESDFFDLTSTGTPKKSKFCCEQEEEEIEGKKEQIEIKQQSNPLNKKSLQQMRQNLQLEVRQDRKIFHNEYFHHFPNTITKVENQMMWVPTETHKKAKRNILSDIRRAINGPMEGKNRSKYLDRLPRCPSDLYYLPIALTSRRASRSLRRVSRESMEDNFERLANLRERNYLKKFSKFISPQ